MTEVVSAMVAASVALRRVRPLLMAALAAAGCLVLSQLPGASTPLWAFATVLLISFSIGSQLRGTRAALGLLLVLGATWVIQFDSSSTWPELVFTPPLIVGAPALAGVLLARSRDQAQQLREVTRKLAAERQKLAAVAATEERARIARDLHDILAHTLSSIVVQAGAAQQLLRPEDAARSPVDEVLTSAREALTEVRSLLALTQTDADHAPRPSLDRLDTLVDADGATLVVTGVPVALPAGLSLALFRVAQESLTNARRHAPGWPVTVHLDYASDALVLQVTSTRVVTGPVTVGRGLTGMAERVAAHGGTLTAGPCTTGWRVVATFPCGGPPQPAATHEPAQPNCLPPDLEPAVGPTTQHPVRA